MSVIISSVLGVTDRNYSRFTTLSDTDKKSDIMVGVVVSNFGMFLCLLMIMILIAAYYRRKVDMLIAEEPVYESLNHQLDVVTDDIYLKTEAVTQEVENTINTERDRSVGDH